MLLNSKPNCIYLLYNIYYTVHQVLKIYIDIWLLWSPVMPLTLLLRFYFYAHVLRLG